MAAPPSASTPATPLFGSRLHELGTRLVDLLNQTSFLYRFPSVAGVTLACISQHLDPVRRLLGACEPERSALGRSQSSAGYSVGTFLAPDPLAAAYDYAATGFRCFQDGLGQVAATVPGAWTDVSAEDIAAFARICRQDEVPDPHALLAVRELIERHSEQAAQRALSRFQPMPDLEWQRLRMTIFYFLLELEKRLAQH